MLHKTSSRIKQFILLKKDKKVRQEDELFHTEIRESRPKVKSCPHLDQECTEASLAGRTNGSPAGQTVLTSLPIPQATDFSLSPISICDYNAAPPHSLLNYEPQSRTLKHLTQRPNGSMQLVLASSVATSLKSAAQAVELRESRSTTQLDLLEALALKPDDDDDKSSSESLMLRKPEFDVDSKDNERVTHTKKCALELPPSTLTDIPATSPELSLKQSFSKPLTQNMSPRAEPHGRFRLTYRPTISIIQAEQSKGLKDDHDDHDDRSDSDFMNCLILKPPASTNSPETMDGIRKRLSAIYSRQHSKQVIVSGRVESDRVQIIRAQNFGKNNSRPSSETSRSTESASTGSTPQEPFHLEDLSLRIGLATGFLAERPNEQHIEARNSIVSTIAPQSTTSPVSSSPYFQTWNGQVADASGHELILRSTNYSLTSLGFRHGDIQLKLCWRSAIRSKTRFSSPESSFLLSSTNSDMLYNTCARNDMEDKRVDDEMDLPEFQTAISGSTVCNWVSSCEAYAGDPRYPVFEDREVNLDELLEWWSYMGLDAGALLQRNPDEECWQAKLQDQRCQQACEEADSIQLSELTSGPLEICRGSDIARYEDGMEELIRPPPHELTEEIEEYLKGSKYEIGRVRLGSQASLPPSPMQIIDPNAVSMTDTVMPMGFNVDHDLVDFLRWKSEYVGSAAEEQS